MSVPVRNDPTFDRCTCPRLHFLPPECTPPSLITAGSKDQRIGARVSSTEDARTPSSGYYTDALGENEVRAADRMALNESTVN
jgi:hypothetical protein